MKEQAMASSTPGEEARPVPVRQLHGRTPAERAALGKELRAKLPRENHAAWDAPSNRPDPIDLLEKQAVTRVQELIPIRYGRMLTSPFAFYRGAAAIMACDLATLPNTELYVQLCGDAHLANFGGFASPERDLVFDVNDFDETLPGPWEWDLKRLSASVEIAGRECGFNSKVRRSIVLATVGEYKRAMREFSAMGNLDVWYALLDAAKIQARWGDARNRKGLKEIAAEFAIVPTRDNLRAFEKLTHRVGDQLRIVSHPPLVVPIEELLPDQPSFAGLEKVLRERLGAYGKSLPDDRRHLLEHYDLLHMARKVVGVGSVGTRTWIVLLQGRDDKDPLFLQIKEAETSVLEGYLGKSRFAEHGKRVVEGQRLMQATSDIFLGWERMPQGIDGQAHDFYVRQLWDWKISADIETMPPQEMTVYGEMCGWVLARAHARTGDRIAIAAYLGKSDAFEQALADFAVSYAEQNQRDYQALRGAVKNGRIQVVKGV